MNFSGMLIYTLMPLLVLRTLGLGPQGMAVIMSVGAAGGLLGAVAAPRLAARIGEGTVIPVCALNSVFLLLVPLAAVVSEPAASLALLLVSELGARIRLQRVGVQHRAAQHAPGAGGRGPGGRDAG
jgi:predicted MFS family arabinose efflux permease